MFFKRDECGRVSKGSFTQDRIGVKLFISRRSASDPEKIESQSKWSQNLDEIGVGIFRAISFLPIPLRTPTLMIQ